MIDFRRMRQLIKVEERLRWAIIREEAKATKITTTLSKSGGSRGGTTSKKVEEGAIAIVILKDEHASTEKELKQQRSELRSQLRYLNEIQRTIMKMRYMQGIGCRDIARAMNYSDDHVYHTVMAAERLISERQKTRQNTTENM